MQLLLSPIALGFKAYVKQALQQPVKLVGFPWAFIKTAGLVVPEWRELAQLSYLFQRPHQLSDPRLDSLIGPTTAPDVAIRQALCDLGLIPRQFSQF